jgi:hypothetical protein
MIDTNKQNDVELENDKTSWYKEHVLSKEQLARLIEKKFNRAFSYQTDSKLLAR